MPRSGEGAPAFTRRVFATARLLAASRWGLDDAQKSLELLFAGVLSPSCLHWAGRPVVVALMEDQAAPPRVLLVEDERALARVYARALNIAGLEVDHVVDGADALERLSTRAYNVVLSDVCMPRMGGLDLLMEVREQHPDLPVILMTARLDAEVYARAREIGTVRYLRKPISLEKMVEAVENGIKLHAILLRSKERKERTSAAR